MRKFIIYSFSPIQYCILLLALVSHSAEAGNRLRCFTDLLFRTSTRTQSLAEEFSLGQRLEALEKAIDRLRPFEDPSLYKALANDAPLAESIIRKWYGDEFASQWILPNRSYGKTHWVLLVDPGVADRAAEFTSFANKLAYRWLSPFALRNKFKQHLGTSRVYRAMVLSPEAAQNIAREGLNAPALVYGQEGQKTLFSSSFEGPVADIQTRTQTFYSRSEPGSFRGHSMSVTEHSDIAIAVTNQIFRPKRQSPEKVYLFTMDVPELSLIRRNQQLINASPSDQYLVVGHDGYGWKAFAMKDGEVESYLFQHVPAEQIVSPPQLIENGPKHFKFTESPGYANIIRAKKLQP